MPIAVGGGLVQECSPLIKSDSESPYDALSIVLQAELFDLVDLIAYGNHALMNKGDLSKLVQLINDHGALLIKEGL